MTSMVLAAIDQQTMTHDMQPFRETLASERRRLGNRSRRDGSGSARDRTVSGASYRTISPWAQRVRESSNIMWLNNSIILASCDAYWVSSDSQIYDTAIWTSAAMENRQCGDLRNVFRKSNCCAPLEMWESYNT